MSERQRLGCLVLLLVTAVVAMTVILSFRVDNLTEDSSQRLWVLVGSYVTGMFSLLGAILVKSRDQEDHQ